MIKLKSGRRKYNISRLWGKVKFNNQFDIPSSWGDITYKQHIDLKNAKDDLETISILSGIPEDLVVNFSEMGMNRLTMVLSFITSPMKLDDYKAPDNLIINNIKLPLVEDIRDKTFGQKISIHELLKGTDDVMECLEEIVLIYAQPYIDDSEFDINRVEELKNSLEGLFFVDLYSTAKHYIMQLNKIVEKEAEELSTTPTTEQIQAGVDMFEEFGVANTIKSLAGGGNDWGLRIPEVERMEYSVAFLVMRMNKVQGIFSDNYRKVLEQKHKTK